MSGNESDDSLDDGKLYDFREAEAFPASGEKKEVAYVDVAQMVMPELRQALRARGKTPAGDRRSLVDRLQKCLIESGESYPPDAEAPEPVAPDEPSHAKDTHVNYIFGAAERDGPEGPPPTNTPRLRKSFSHGRPAGLHMPFGSDADVPPASPGGGVPRSPGPLASPVGPRSSVPRTSLSRPAPFKTDEAAPFTQRAEQLPSAPPASPGSVDAAALAIVAKMTLPELRETLRGRGLSPAGGLTTLQERLTDALKGMPLDTPLFVPTDSGMDWPVPGEVDPKSKPTSQARRSIRISNGGASAGGGVSSLGYMLGGV